MWSDPDILTDCPVFPSWVVTMEPWQQQHGKKKRRTKGPEPVVFSVYYSNFMVGLNMLRGCGELSHIREPDICQITSECILSISLHYNHSKCKHPAASYNYSFCFAAHHTFTAVSELTSTWIQTDLKWEGNKSYCPLTLSSSSTASTALTSVCLESPLNLAHGQESWAKKRYWSSNLTGHWMGRSTATDESCHVLSEKLDVFQKGEKKHSAVSHTAKHNQFLMFSAWLNDLVVKSFTLNANVKTFCILKKTQPVSLVHTHIHIQ